MHGSFRPTLNLEYHSLFAVLDSIFKILLAALHIYRPFLPNAAHAKRRTNYILGPHHKRRHLGHAMAYRGDLGSVPGAVHVRVLVRKVALGRIFPKYLRFSPVRIMPPVLHTYM
jgi:hypothetical protein